MKVSTKAMLVCAALLGGVAACNNGESVGREQTLAADHMRPVDLDGDGSPDAIDVDGDGMLDVTFGGMCGGRVVDADADGHPDGVDRDCDGVAEVTWCRYPLVDLDADGIPDGMDLDCDGVMDLPLERPCAHDAMPPTMPTMPPPPPERPVMPVPGTEGCVPRVLDSDADGMFDGVDLDCDGAVDVTF